MRIENAPDRRWRKPATVVAAKRISIGAGRLCEISCSQSSSPPSKEDNPVFGNRVNLSLPELLGKTGSHSFHGALAGGEIDSFGIWKVKRDYGKVWRDRTLAAKYVSGIRAGLPLASEQLGMMVRVIAALNPKVKTFADLGCGDGVLSAALLGQFPRSSGSLVDHSAPMLEGARNRFGNSKRRLEFIEADLSKSSWRKSLSESAVFDAVVSGFAIHHLSNGRKRRLYAEIYELLSPGGVFINIEHVASPTPEVERVFNESLIDALYDHDRKSGGRKSRKKIASEYVYRPDKAANILAPAEMQCGWLRRIGYTHVDCYLKYLELAVFGGQRPGS